MSSCVRPLCALVLVAAFAVTARAQQMPPRPDFTGSWRVESVQATPDANQSADGGFGRRGGFGGGAGGRRAGGGGGRPGGAPDGNRGERQGMVALQEGQVLHLKQTEERLIMTIDGPNGQIMTSYALDGSESRNHPAPEVTIKSKSKWEGVALVTESKQEITTGRGSLSLDVREVLSLSADGTTLTLTRSQEIGRGKRLMTATLTRVQD